MCESQDLHHKLDPQQDSKFPTTSGVQAKVPEVQQQITALSTVPCSIQELMGTWWLFASLFIPLLQVG